VCDWGRQREVHISTGNPTRDKINCFDPNIPYLGCNYSHPNPVGCIPLDQQRMHATSHVRGWVSPHDKKRRNVSVFYLS
jgi:hypothetical protein